MQRSVLLTQRSQSFADSEVPPPPHFVRAAHSGIGEVGLIDGNAATDAVPSPERSEEAATDKSGANIAAFALENGSHSVQHPPATIIGLDGIARPNPHVEAPLAGRSAEKNAIRRENKFAAVEAANADAKRLGGWGDNGEAASQLPNINRRQRNQWIGKCVRRWCQQKKSALLEGTSRLVANGGYRFLQELWERGVPMTMEDAIDALEVFLNAKQG